MVVAFTEYYLCLYFQSVHVSKTVDYRLTMELILIYSTMMVANLFTSNVLSGQDHMNVNQMEDIRQRLLDDPFGIPYNEFSINARGK